MHEVLCAYMLHSFVSKTMSNFFSIIITPERDKKTSIDLAIKPLSFPDYVIYVDYDVRLRCLRSRLIQKRGLWVMAQQ